MMTVIDPAAAAGAATQTPNVRRPEMDRVAETYRTPGAGVRDVASRDNVPSDQADNAARQAERTAAPGQRGTGARTDTGLMRRIAATGDQAQINFQMSREEREVFLSAMTGREKVSDMSEQEQKLMERATERLEKLIEAADARDTASRERVDKAVKEWYYRLSNGKQPPTDLLTLIRQSAAGKLD